MADKNGKEGEKEGESPVPKLERVREGSQVSLKVVFAQLLIFLVSQVSSHTRSSKRPLEDVSKNHFDKKPVSSELRKCFYFSVFVWKTSYVGRIRTKNTRVSIRSEGGKCFTRVSIEFKAKTQGV